MYKNCETIQGGRKRSGRSVHARTKFSADKKKLPFNPFPNNPWVLCVSSTSLLKALWKRRNCSLRAISFFPTVFSTRLGNFSPFPSNLKLSSANSFSLEESKICCLGKSKGGFPHILSLEKENLQVEKCVKTLKKRVRIHQRASYFKNFPRGACPPPPPDPPLPLV